VWSPNGKELFYQNEGKLMSVEATAQGADLNVNQMNLPRPHRSS
jgi:hypothetical protein